MDSFNGRRVVVFAAGAVIVSVVVYKIRNLLRRSEPEQKPLADHTPEGIDVAAAIRVDDSDVVDTFLAQGGSANARIETIQGKFHALIGLCAIYGSNACMEVLLQSGADPDPPDRDGMTPLHMAVSSGWELCAQLLIQAGANLESRTRDFVARDGGLSQAKVYCVGGRTPLHLAAANKEDDVIPMLLLNNADTKALDLNGDRPVDVYCMGTHREFDRERVMSLWGEIPEATDIRPAAADVFGREVAPEPLKVLTWDDRERRAKLITDGRIARRDAAAQLRRRSLKYLAKSPEWLDPSRWVSLLHPSAVEVIKELQASVTMGSAAPMPVGLTRVAPKVYTVRLFPEKVAITLMNEIENIRAWHESHNDAVLADPERVGFDLDHTPLHAFLDYLLMSVLIPSTRTLYPEHKKVSTAHAFYVEYEPGKRESMAPHVDSSLVTLNVCLGDYFEGGDLYFDRESTPHNDSSVQRRFVDTKDLSSPLEKLPKHLHRPGVAIIHVGNMVHGTTPILSGHRGNLILWARRKNRTA